MRRSVRAARTLARILLLVAVGLAPCAAPAGAQPWRASVLARADAEPAAADTSARAAAPTPEPAPAPALAPAERVVPPVERQPWIGFPIAAGLVGASAGGSTGALIGFAADQSEEEFFPTGIVSGFLVGEALLLPLGVHLGNARRGRFIPDLAASVLGGIGALGLGSLSGDGSLYILGLGLQLGATVYAEREGATSKDEERRAESTRGVYAPAPPPEPDPLVPPPPAEK